MINQYMGVVSHLLSRWYIFLGVESSQRVVDLALNNQIRQMLETPIFRSTKQSVSEKVFRGQKLQPCSRVMVGQGLIKCAPLIRTLYGLFQGHCFGCIWCKVISIFSGETVKNKTFKTKYPNDRVQQWFADHPNTWGADISCKSWSTWR